MRKRLSCAHDQVVFGKRKEQVASLLQTFQTADAGSLEWKQAFDELYRVLNPELLDNVGNSDIALDAVQTIWVEGFVDGFSGFESSDFKAWFLGNATKLISKKYWESKRVVSTDSFTTPEGKTTDFYEQTEVAAVLGLRGEGARITQSAWRVLKPLLDDFQTRYPESQLAKAWIASAFSNDSKAEIAQCYGYSAKMLPLVIETFQTYLQEHMTESLNDLITLQKDNRSGFITPEKLKSIAKAAPISQILSKRRDYVNTLLGDDHWQQRHYLLKLMFYDPFILEQRSQDLDNILGRDKWKDYPLFLLFRPETLKRRADKLNELFGDQWKHNSLWLTLSDQSSDRKINEYLLLGLPFREWRPNGNPQYAAEKLWPVLFSRQLPVALVESQDVSQPRFKLELEAFKLFIAEHPVLLKPYDLNKYLPRLAVDEGDKYEELQDFKTRHGLYRLS